MLPWTTLLPAAVVAGWRRTPGRFQANRLFVLWAAFIFLFFSASSSKLPSYILPVFPALALLVAQHLERLGARRFALHAALVLAIAAAAAAAVLLAPQFLGRESKAPMALDLAYRNWILAGIAVIAAGSALSLRLARGGAKTAAVLALAFAGLAGTQLVLLGHQSFAQLKSARTMVEAIRGSVAPDAPFYSVGTHDQTLPFYLRRPVTLVAWFDEFATGIRIEPQRQIPTVAQFEARWREQPGAAAMMRLETFVEFERNGLPMRVVYRDSQRVVVVRP
jgi:4-amino-4-deoxy-L-arabinose transferase-like glycosyltransferase